MVCAHAVRVAMTKVEGVESVAVSLNEGTATLKLKPGNRVDPSRIRQIVLDNGFTPKGADVRVAGRLVERDGKPALEGNEVDPVYALEAHPEAVGRFVEMKKVALGANVIVDGHLPEGPEPSSLQVRDFVLVDR